MNDKRSNPPIFARGAVDLSALRNSPPAAPPQPGPAGPSGPAPRPRQAAGVAVIDVTEATFQSEVLERSLTTPVVIDFWADWCAPCKQLSPVLEKLAIAAGGAWVLAKVDVDANPRLAQMFRVQSIPMVYAISAGQPVDAFMGVVPEPQLRQWLDAILKASGIEVEQPADPRLEAADDALMVGDLDTAEQACKKILAESPADASAEAGLAQVGLLRRADGADPADLRGGARGGAQAPAVAVRHRGTRRPGGGQRPAGAGERAVLAALAAIKCAGSPFSTRRRT